jgi:hypothetical protein
MGIGFFAAGDSKNKIATCRWHVVATSSKTGGYQSFPTGKKQTDRAAGHQESPTPSGVGDFCRRRFEE